MRRYSVLKVRCKYRVATLSRSLDNHVIILAKYPKCLGEPCYVAFPSSLSRYPQNTNAMFDQVYTHVACIRAQGNIAYEIRTSRFIFNTSIQWTHYSKPILPLPQTSLRDSDKTQKTTRQPDAMLRQIPPKSCFVRCHTSATSWALQS